MRLHLPFLPLLRLRGPWHNQWYAPVPGFRGVQALLGTVDLLARCIREPGA